MTVAQIIALAAWVVVSASLVGGGMAAQRQFAPDPRNFANGNRIPVEGYADQPRIVVTRDGTWVCVLTTGPGVEGA